MWLYLGMGIYLGVALAALALLTFTWLGDVRRARALGAPLGRRYLGLYLFMVVASALWPLGLVALWARTNRRAQQHGLHHPAP